MFDIPLMGEGTGSVEALPSYLHRCAYHHAVPTTKFLEYLHGIYNRSLEGIKCPDFKASQTVSMRSLLTHGEYTKIYVELVEAMTGRNVMTSTFLPLTGVITHPQKEIHRGVRWCPECFRAIRKIGGEPYIKLIWHLSEISHCPHHLTPLMEVCPHCGEKQNAIGRKLALDICHKCEGSLTVRMHLDYADIKPSWMHQAADLLLLLTQLAFRSNTLPSSNGYIDPSGLEQSLGEFSIHCLEAEFGQAYRYCWANREVRKQIWGHAGVSIRTLRALAHLTSVDIFDLLAGNLMQKTKAAPVLWHQELPDVLEASGKRQSHDHDKNFHVLNEFFRYETPLSLKEVAKRSGLSIGYISYRFPVLKQKIIERYQKHIDQLSIAKRHLANQQALRYFNGEEYRCFPKSRKQALKHLLDDTDLTKLYLKPAIKKAHSEYAHGKDGDERIS